MKRSKVRIQIGAHRRSLRIGELVQVVSGSGVYRTRVVALGKSGGSFRVVNKTGRKTGWLRYTGRNKTWILGWKEAAADVLRAQIVLRALIA